MNTSIYNISLDLHDQVAPKSLFVKRGDTARELRVTLVEDGKPYEITPDCTPKLCGVLPTGTSAELTMTAAGNILSVAIPSAWVTTAGEIVCEVRVSSGTELLLISPTFTIVCGAEYSASVTIDQTLPLITSADNGKALTATDGVWAKGPNLVHIGESTEVVDEEVIKPVVGLNLFDEEHNSHERVSVPESEYDWMYRIGTVYLDGYEGDLVISCKQQKHDYITNLHVYDEDGTDMEVEFDEDVVVNSIPNGLRSGNLAEIPEGAVYLTFQYRVYNADSSPLVEEVMVTKGDTITAYYLAYETTPIYIINAENRIKRAAYVSTTGDDSNDGLTPETAVATFSRALGISDIIFAERGVYNEAFTISGRRGIRISPYDNDEEFVSGTPRQKIELTGGDDYLKSELTLDDGLYKVDCENGLQFSAIFNPDYPEPLDPIAPNGAYRANVFVHLTTHGKKRLKPVLSKALCAEDDTFWYDYANKVLWMNISTADFDSVTVHARTEYLRIEDSSDIEIQDVAVRYGYSSAIKIDNSIGVTLTNCEASYSGTTMGFEVNNSNVKLIHCYATNNWYDGFNFHQYGQSEMYDCVAEFNWDDGCSHHNGCYGAIYGGEFNGNGKGGVTPAYGANVNIYNVLAKGNDRCGLAFLYTSGSPPMKSIVSGCAVVNNPTGIKVEQNWTVQAIGLKYSGNTTDKTVTGTLNEY